MLGNVVMKNKIMMVLSKTGSQGERYTITISMKNTFVNTTGTEFTDLIACGKSKIASTGDFITTIVNEMFQVPHLKG
jgi:Domain of unknown function (DUF1966)